MPNLMPTDVLWEFVVFLRQLLNLVFAEVATPYIIKCHDVVGRLGLGDGKKRNVSRKLAADFGVFFCTIHRFVFFENYWRHGQAGTPALHPSPTPLPLYLRLIIQYVTN
jgi:hypothetical protein